MAIDLTKPIKIPRAWWTELMADGSGGLYGASCFGCKNTPASEAEAYRRLFEAAPKMLALLRQEMRENTMDYGEVGAVLAKIDGGVEA